MRRDQVGQLLAHAVELFHARVCGGGGLELQPLRSLSRAHRRVRF
jgi:hypothetical protein